MSVFSTAWTESTIIRSAASEKLPFRLKLSLRLRIIYRRWKTKTCHNEAKYLLALEERKSPLLSHKKLVECLWV